MIDFTSCEVNKFRIHTKITLSNWFCYIGGVSYANIKEYGNTKTTKLAGL